MSVEMGGPYDELRARRVEVGEDSDEVDDFFYEQGWSDGLPVVPPTPERVLEMVRGANAGADEVVARLEPAGADATVEKIAINAVMAGCKPAYMPTVVAAVRALGREEFNLHGIQATTNPATPLLVVNGPVRSTIGLNCQRNALGPGVRANATIGRAIRLVMINIGGGIPQEIDRASLGLPSKYTCCLGENEEESPWSPLHVERGFDVADSTVTVVGVSSFINAVLLTASRPDALEIQLDIVADAMKVKSSATFIAGRGPIIVVVPSAWAHMLDRAGYDRHKIKRELWQRSSVPVEMWPESHQEPKGQPREQDGRYYVTNAPEDILILVAGGDEPIHAMVMPSFGDTVAVTEQILQG